jgi:nitrogen-specific signal transduction histidine kinase
MKTKSRVESQEPALAIRVHLTNGSVESFAPTSEAKVKKLWDQIEPFFTTKPVGTGTGFGLINSNRIVADGHVGEIEFESRPGETIFKVRFRAAHTAEHRK